MEQSFQEGEPIEVEPGQMQIAEAKSIKPQLVKDFSSKNDQFYIKYSQEMNNKRSEAGQNAEKVILNRLEKFFTPQNSLTHGFRMSKIIDPDYSKTSVQSLPNAVMLYGTDFLSNKQIRQIFNLEKSDNELKRINWSNTAIIFKSVQDMHNKVAPQFSINEKLKQFLGPKQEQDEDIEQEGALEEKPQNPIMTQKINEKKKQSELRFALHTKWYPLKNYTHNQLPSFWFIRYLTSHQCQNLNSIKESNEIRYSYETAQKRYSQRKILEESYYESNYPSRETSKLPSKRESLKSSFLQNDSKEKIKESRERSRDNKADKMMEDEDGKSVKSVLDILEGKREYSALNQSAFDKYDKDGAESVKSGLSFFCNPKEKGELDEHALKLALQMNDLEIQEDPNKITLQQMQNINPDFDNSMDFIIDSYDPEGRNDRLVRENENTISKLTKVNPFSKFNYNEYNEEVIHAEELAKKEKSEIPVITLD